MDRRTEKPQILREIGDAIRHHRLAKGWSQEELSFNSGLHRTYIGAVERGERNVSVLSLQKIAHAMEIPVAALFRDREKQSG